MRNFVVAAWERTRHRERRLSKVEADTAEQAILKVAASGPESPRSIVYEAWPPRDPERNLRMTLEPVSSDARLP